MPTSAASSTRSTTSGCCGCWRTGSPILGFSGSSGCGLRPASSRATSGTRRTGERRKERASARCWPTSSCITCSICWYINGVGSMHAVWFGRVQGVAGGLEADIRSFFDSFDHEWLLRMLSDSIADPRVLRLVRMWLEAGILESDEWHETDRGTPQGAGISPLLANIFLHYVLDLWVHQWRRRHARGLVSIVRYADDFVMGFEKEADARQMLADLKERLVRFGLLLHEDKTRLNEVGRAPALARRQRGERSPAAFAFDR